MRFLSRHYVLTVCLLCHSSGPPDSICHKHAAHRLWRSAGGRGNVRFRFRFSFIGLVARRLKIKKGGKCPGIVLGEMFEGNVRILKQNDPSIIATVMIGNTLVNTHWHTQRDSFWPAILLAQPAELKNHIWGLIRILFWRDCVELRM